MELIIAVSLWCGQPLLDDTLGQSFSRRKKEIDGCRERIIKCVENSAPGSPNRPCFLKEKLND